MEITESKLSPRSRAGEREELRGRRAEEGEEQRVERI